MIILIVLSILFVVCLILKAAEKISELQMLNALKDFEIKLSFETIQYQRQVIKDLQERLKEDIDSADWWKDV